MGTCDTNFRIAVIGLGMLGSAVARRCRDAGHAVRGYDLPDWDLTRQEDLETAVSGVEVVVNCAAYTDVDGAESQVNTAFAVNAEAPRRLAELAAAAGFYLVHIGTDFVFDGHADRPYTESDPVNPLSVYGRSKAAGEAAVLAAAATAAVLRVQWTYGANGNNFVTKIAALARSRARVRVVDDQVGAPTWVEDVVGALEALIARRVAGLFHFAASGYASRFEVAQAIAAGLALPCDVQPCASAEFKTAAERPLNSRFNCEKFDREIGAPRPFWRDSLDAYLETLT